jgi:transposase
VGCRRCTRLGPPGYGLQRTLSERGDHCQVVAPSLIPRRPGDRIKTDRRDSVRLAELSRAGELTAIWIPEPGDEAVRDVSRAREDAVGMRLSARQQLLAFLLRHDVRYSGKTRWSLAHRRWLATVSFDTAGLQVTFTEYCQAVQNAEERVARLTEAVGDALHGWRFEPQVAALQALRGIDLVSAVGLVAEIGDLARFAHPREVMSYIGLVPSEHARGPSVRRGGITKTGNTHARRLLVEAAWNYRFHPRIGVRAQRRQESVPEAPRTLAWKAQLRLCTRFQRLSARGLHRNKVCVAVARELAGFVWAIARATPVAD